LSPYLAVGAVSLRQCLWSALDANQGRLEGGNQGLSTWINELIWREFYKHIVRGFPEVCRYRPFKADTASIPWRHDAQLFQQWCRGLTGFPLVDAAMRQLNETGWMHNRLRMVTAMFLTKHLLVDWRWGERYFMNKLVDADFAANNGGWQWSASTGADAAPYFRVFNPTRQSQRFDPEGRFIRRYLPHMAGLDNAAIHDPAPLERAAIGYPMPIVDHALAVKQVKTLFQAALNSSN
jgi:deoxyribodipyrimidine photo-lyase